MLYRRGQVWWLRIKFAGLVIRESAKTSSKAVARRVEQKRRRDLEEGYNGLSKRQAPLTFDEAADRWLEARSVSWSPKTIRSEQKIGRAHV